MLSEVIHYESDGLMMKSELFLPNQDQGCHPGVLVFPEATGLGEHARVSALRLADLGYAVLACDLHGEGGTIPLEDVREVIGPLIEAPDRMRNRALNALAALKSRSEVDPYRIAAIGYCFGGAIALELARAGGEIVAAVGVHCHLATVERAEPGTIKARILVCVGADDPTIDISQRGAFEDEMRTQQVDWQINVYGGAVHSFTNPRAGDLGLPDFARYDALIDARSWAEMIRLLEEVF